MSCNILFWPDINYEPGHWRPVMSMAQKIKNSGIDCTVRFLCTPECKPIVDSVKMPNGSRLFLDNEIITILKDIFPVGYSSLADEKPEEAHSRIKHCQKIAEGELDGLLETFKPHLLVAGYFVSMEALLIQYRYNKIIRHRLNSVPPEMKIMVATTFLRHPSEDPAITSLRFLAHHAQEHSSKLMQAATGESSHSGSFSSMQEFIKPLETVTELITCPRELDHDHFKHRKNTHYVEPCILDTDPNSVLTKDKKLIYASAGSRVRDYVESAKTMFRTLQEMLNNPQASGRKLEMAVGYALREEFAPAENIAIAEWAEQTNSLKRARSAVVHGGLATIKECIYFGVPPIVIPLGKDQMDNALRVASKEVGAMIMLGGLTSESLCNAVIKAERNLGIKKNLTKMQGKFKSAESAKPSLSHIKKELGIA